MALPTPGGDLPAIQRGRPRVGIAVSLVALAALVPAFLFLVPDPSWQPEDLFVLLLSFGFVSYAAAVRLRGDVTLDAGFVAALLATVYFGALPGTLVFSAPELGRWLSGSPFHRFLSNIATLGWSVMSAALVLDALGSQPPVNPDDVGAYAAIGVAGLTLILVNFFIGALLGGVLSIGISLRVMVKREFVPTAPLDVALVGASLLTIFLYEQFGIPGLAPLAAILLIPRLVIPVFLKRKPVSQLQPFEATSLYAQAIAAELGVGGSTKRVLADAATHFGGSARLTRIEDFQSVMRAVLYCKEPWDGESGTEGTASGDDIPIESRILAVANAWSTLTAGGTTELSPDQALHHLKARSGIDLDPRVVAAALMVVEHEALPVTR